MPTSLHSLADVALILQCPVTGQALHLLDVAKVEELRQAILADAIRHLDGSPARMKPDAVLGSEDGQLFYAVVDDILILLPTLAMTTAGNAGELRHQMIAPDTEKVRQFYDEIGWQGGEGESFEDARRWEDMRPVSADYIHRCHLRVNRYLPPKGRYLLDIASGPIQYDEYLSYSESYDVRICADISITALRAARRRLGAKGLYVQCDVTRLPFKAGSLDAFVSLHTLYHVPADLQVLAFQELERVLQPGHSGVVVYSWGRHSRLTSILEETTLRTLIKGCLPDGLLKRMGVKSVPGQTAAVEALYFAPHDYRWFRTTIAAKAPWELNVWRFASVPVLQRFAHEKRMGRLLLRMLYGLENGLPALLGRLGMYPMMVLRK